ncbi:MAG: hypothetical protein Satyrvirus18_6 [Satyrvirus sp.]|uniref:DUF7275 domain-containing protein n=1 Tax=Satyrvirus sp. TaxID=2487771 RepID=A0A3G5AJ66_9VIRU|nr:MAG: hypothetical protein Satyrvirus18_6 [Satyrvirus sp.]
MLPVIIGSYALFEHGLVKSFSDIDLVVDKMVADKLMMTCNIKKGNLLWFDDVKVDLCLATDPSSITLLEKCNLFDHFNCKKISLSMVDAILPPLEIIYTIYKSHIHRILPLTTFQDQNIEIWLKYVRHYQMIRNRIGYEKLDNMMYIHYLGELHRTNALFESQLEKFMTEFYKMRFEETNKKFGDTTISLDKTQDEFFKDNVERFIDHDKLHEEVGIAFRSDPNPIFKKYQTDPFKVNLDFHIFIRSSKEERFAMICEEIMVLLLERKWIPEIIKCYKDMNIPYTDCNFGTKKKELVEIGANFITNLCGQGDAWLRRYCLDHANLLLDTEFYDFEKLKHIALKITNYDLVSEIVDQKEDIFSEILKYKKENYPYIKPYMRIIANSQQIVDKGEDPFIDQKFLGKKIIKYVKTYYLANITIDCETSQPVCMSKLPLDNDSITKNFRKYFYNIYNVGYAKSHNEYTIFNIKNNVGINQQNGDIIIFTLKFSNEDNKFHIRGSYIDVSENKTSFKSEYIKKYREAYYVSSGCEEESDKDYRKFLSSYGTAPIFMRELFEMFAKNYLDKLVKTGYEYNSTEWTSSDSDGYGSDSQYYC